MNQDTNQGCWNADYRHKGKMYGGFPRHIPSFPDGARVLELGCGDGKTLSALVHRGWDITAIDFSPMAISLAQAVVRHGAGATLVVADAREIPFCNRTFDAVVAIHLLGHSMARERMQIAREIHRVTRPGGQLFFSDFSTRDFRYGTGREAEPGTFMRGTGILTHYFFRDELTGLFSGFVPESFQQEEWMLRVRGSDHLRSEITMTFRRNES